MSRIRPIDPERASEPGRGVLAAIHSGLGMTPNLFKVAANSAAVVDALAGFIGALSKGALDARSRESIALAVAEANGCDYCLSAHRALGAGAGLSAAEIADAREGRATNPKINALLAFARDLVINRGHTTDSELERLRTAGASDSEIVEVIANTALNIFTNYLNHVAETDIDFPVVRAGESVAA